MHDLSRDGRELLAEVWDEAEDMAWGPPRNEFFASHLDKVPLIEDLMLKELLIQEMDPKGVFRIKFQRDAFFYLDPPRQAAASRGADEVIEAVKRLYKAKKGNPSTLEELATESDLSPEAALRVVHLLRSFGFSVSVFEVGSEPQKITKISPSEQIAKVTTYEDLFEKKRKEHEQLVEQRKRMSQGDYSSFFPANAAVPSVPAIDVDTSEKLSEAELYNALILHPEIRSATEGLFRDGHYASAILEAFKTVNILVKNKSGRPDLDGSSLMSTVFSDRNSILKLNAMATETDQNEQKGFMMIFMGVMLGIRNPKAHDRVIQKDPIHTLQYLALADLLARRVDESTR